MPALLDELYAAGVRREDVTLVFALGSHRRHTDEERLVSRAPAQASLRTIMEWLDWMASRVDTPGIMALAPPE